MCVQACNIRTPCCPKRAVHDNNVHGLSLPADRAWAGLVLRNVFVRTAFAVLERHIGYGRRVWPVCRDVTASSIGMLVYFRTGSRAVVLAGPFASGLVADNMQSKVGFRSEWPLMAVRKMRASRRHISCSSRPDENRHVSFFGGPASQPQLPRCQELYLAPYKCVELWVLPTGAFVLMSHLHTSVIFRISEL